MIDLHTHILPNIDDGAKDVTVSAELMNAEKAQGVETVVFTPHYYGKRSSPEQFLKKRASAFESVRSVLPDGMSVRLGCEVHFTGLNMPDPQELCRLAIEGTRYILLEFPFTTGWQGGLLDKVNEFISDTGYTPIVAHVERYAEVQRTPEYAVELAKMGCLLQLNAEAFLNKAEKKLAFALLRNGLAHCLGTDAHDTTLRAPRYAEAKRAVEAAGLSALWEQAQVNMQNVLNDEETDLPPFSSVRKTLFGYK